MRTTQALLPNEVYRQLVRRAHRLLLGVEHNSGNHAPRPVVNGHFLDGDPIGNRAQADRVTAPVVHKPLLNIPSDLSLIHMFRRVRTDRLIVHSHARRTKCQKTIASVAPPLNLRTQVAVEGPR